MTCHEVKTDKDHDLTQIVFFGKIFPTDILVALKTFFESEVTSKILWDFSNSDVSGMKKVDFDTLNATAKGYAHLRSSGKTALVAPGDLAFGLCRMYTTLAEINGYLIQYGIFRSVDEARDWLNL